MIVYSLLSLKEKLKEGVNAKVDALNQGIIDTIKRMSVCIHLNRSGVCIAK